MNRASDVRRRRLRIPVARVPCPHCGQVLHVDVWPDLREAAERAERPSQPLFRVDCTRGCTRKVVVRAEDVRTAA